MVSIPGWMVTFKAYYSNSNHNFVIHIETINKYYSVFSTFYSGNYLALGLKYSAYQSSDIL